MNEFTAHVQVPDAAIGAVLHDILLGIDGVSCVTLRSGNGTWVSFGVRAETDDAASMSAGSIRYQASRAPVEVPVGYEKESLLSFESAPMIITNGRVVIHSEGI